MRVAVCGLGYWGPRYARVVREAWKEMTLAAIIETSPTSRVAAARQFLTVGVASLEEALDSVDFDAVMIATPPSTHYALARQALLAGKHVLVAKPLTEVSWQADELAILARAQGCVLLVDHTFLYTGAVRKLRDLIDQETFGELLYLDSVRANLGLFHPSTNVLWDLAPHDLSILDLLVAEQPLTVGAITVDRAGSGQEDIAYLSLRYPSGLVANVHLNWLSPVKIRRMLIGGSTRMAVYDDTEPSEKVRVYDSGVNVDLEAARVDYRVGDCWTPKLDIQEALLTELQHFTACVEGRTPPLSDGASGARVVRILEAATLSARLATPVTL